MAEHSERFVAYLQTLASRDRGAMAALRHSLSWPLGEDAQIFAYVEQFAGHSTPADDPHRLALYAVAGLFAQHPEHASQRFAFAFGQLAARRGSASIEQRFIALLEADADSVIVHLRQAIKLLTADKIGLDYSALVDDLSLWLKTYGGGLRLAAIRQAWARDYYRAVLMSEDNECDGESLVAYLQELVRRRDRAALAALRNSLSHAPGDYPAAYPHVEPFVSPEWSIFDSRRKSRYLVAGIVALSPRISQHQSLAAALGHVARRRESKSVEGRFIALLGADDENISGHLRQVVRLVATETLAYNPARLIADLSIWLNPWAEPVWLDRIRQEWARDFYRAVQTKDESESTDIQN